MCMQTQMHSHRFISLSVCLFLSVFLSLSLCLCLSLCLSISCSLSLCLPLFSRGHTTLHLAVSVGRSVGRSVLPSVRPSHFWIPGGFCITVPAQPSATVLPCIRPCFSHRCLFSQFCHVQTNKCVARYITWKNPQFVSQFSKVTSYL